MLIWVLLIPYETDSMILLVLACLLNYSVEKKGSYCSELVHPHVLLAHILELSEWDEACCKCFEVSASIMSIQYLSLCSRIAIAVSSVILNLSSIKESSHFRDEGVVKSQNSPLMKFEILFFNGEQFWIC